MATQELACSICPGYGSVWLAACLPDGTPDLQTFAYMQGTDSWSLEAQVTEASKKRTSATCGQAVSFCRDTVDWRLEVETTLCPFDWLYCYIGQPFDVTQGKDVWAFLSWDFEYTRDYSGDFCHNAPVTLPQFIPVENGIGGFCVPANGITINGTTTPQGMTVNNTNNDPVTTTWSININRIYFPCCLNNGTSLPIPQGIVTGYDEPPT